MTRGTLGRQRIRLGEGRTPSRKISRVGIEVPLVSVTMAWLVCATCYVIPMNSRRCS